MAQTSIVIIDAETSLYTLRVALEQRYDVAVSHAYDTTVGLELVRDVRPDYILVNPNSIGAQVREFWTHFAQLSENAPLIVVGDENVANDLRMVYTNVVGYVPTAYSESDLLPFFQPQRTPQIGQTRGRALAERAALVQTNRLLEQRVQEMVTLYQIGKAVASLTDLDAILTRIVEAAVFLLHAEEASIMLRDRETDELFLRAQKGLGEKQARGFNLKIEDTLIGSVVQTNRPVRLARGTSNDTRLKVVTGYLVNALLYVPLALRGRVIGVLGVANQTAHRAFNDHDQLLMEALADYATLAIEVACQHEELQHWHEELAVMHTVAASVEELRARLVIDDPDVLSALYRIESAAHILTRLMEKGAPVDV
jgi:ActR/RegA family two-component response regulator